MMFAKPVALNRDAHRNLLFRRTDVYDFAAGMHVAPLCAAEFFVAAKEYAIVFVRSPGQPAFPVIVLGLTPQENSFVAPDGQWRGRYLPLAVRSYPFALLESAGNGGSQVIIDETYPGFDLTAGAPLFGDGGKPAPELQQRLTELQSHQLEVTRTRSFVAELERLELLTERQASVTLDGKTQFHLNGFLVVDEVKLNALTDPDALALARSGHASLITAHLMSIGNLGLLTARTSSDGAAPPSKPTTTKKRKVDHAKE